MPAPRSRKVKKSIAPTLKSFKSVINEGWAQRPEPAGLPRKRRSMSRESTFSTRTRAASLGKLQTGSIKRTSLIGRYLVENTVRNEDEMRKVVGVTQKIKMSSQKGGVNVIAEKSSKIAKVKNTVTMSDMVSLSEKQFKELFKKLKIYKKKKQGQMKP